jgi:flagellar biosynthesis/type III secretory pathway chaperone
MQALRREQASVSQLMRAAEEEQELILRRQAQGLLPVIERLERFSQGLAKASQERREAIQELSTRLLRRASDSLDEVAKRLHPNDRKQVDSLVRDIGNRFERCRRLVRQNHLLISRTLEFQQQLRRRIDPGQQWISSYNDRGEVAHVRAGSVPRWQNIV